MKTKFFCIALVGILLLSTVACQTKIETPDESSSHNTATSATMTVVETTEELRPELPETDMDGRIFTILCADWSGYTPLEITDIFVEQDSEEALASATFYRNLHVAETFNCQVAKMDVTAGKEFMTIRSANNAGDCPYDICLVRSAHFNTLVSAGVLMDLDELPYTDFASPWWNEEAYNALSVIGHHFGATSDITMNDDLATWVTFFSKDLIDDNTLESPYDLVKAGQWTMDKMYEMGKTAAKDVDNNGMAFENDIWGIDHIRDNFTGMLNSCDILIAENDSDGVPTFTIDSEESVTKILHIFELLYDTDTVINMHAMASGIDESVPFMENRVLFFIAGLYQGNKLRNMDYPYGIIPLPKYDEAQADYLGSSSGLFTALVTIPAVVYNLNDLGIFIEEYTWYGYEKIRPIFYENLLERKIAYDEESADMLNYIFDRMVYDTGNIGNYGKLAENLIWMTNSYDSGISSFLAKQLPYAKQQVKKMIDYVERFQNS